MPSTFYTLYGSHLHGVKMTWMNDPTAAGDRELTMKFDLNWYSAKFTPGIISSYTTGGVTYPADSFYLTTGWDTITHSTANPWGKVVHFQFTWQNPASGGFPTFDGFDAQFKASIGTVDLDRISPTLKFEWFVPGNSFIFPAGTTVTAT